MGFQHLVFGSFQTVVGKGSCYSSLAGPPENRWWLLKSLPRATPPPTVARDNGLLYRELAPPQVILPQVILLKTLGSSHCLLSLTSSSFLNLLQAGPHPWLFHWENTLWLCRPNPVTSFFSFTGPSEPLAPSDAGDPSLLLASFSFLLVCVVSLFCIFLHTIIFLFVFCVGVLPVGHSPTWTLVFLNFSLTFLSLHSSSPPTLSTDPPAPGFQF